MLRAETKHRMGRRMYGWDYAGRSIYMITLTIEGRRPLLGKLVECDGKWMVEPSDAGRIVEQCLAELPQHWPGVSLICTQLMPDHLHFIIFVEKNQPKPLGAIVGSLKSKSTSRVLNLAARGEAQSKKFWAPGYVDIVLLRRGQLEKMIAYLQDNPRHLAIKRANPTLFKVVRDLPINFAARGEARNQGACADDVLRLGACAKVIGHFMAIGNHFLLDYPEIRQVQCSRSYFSYARERLSGGGWRILRDAKGKPVVAKTTPEFATKAAELLEAARHGAVLVSPCISHGEREIARLAFEAGYRVIALQNKGFSPIYKPGGKLFETCANGNLLLLAPIAWPYVPGEKLPTRESSQILNRIAQLLAGDGAVPIDYHGVVMQGIEEGVAEACQMTTRK
ncbi:MAG: transposase [Victivallales bacterium]|nr:transposase [Victivallales bacterium]